MSLFFETLLITFFAFDPNSNEDKVSLNCFTEGDIQVITTVRQFPPNEFYKNLVSLESL